MENRLVAYFKLVRTGRKYQNNLFKNCLAEKFYIKTLFSQMKFRDLTNIPLYFKSKRNGLQRSEIIWVQFVSDRHIGFQK